MTLKITYSFRHFSRIFFLYSAFATTLLAPIANNTFIPIMGMDILLHTSGIVQASMALKEGQFPIRIAPYEHGGLRYPEFQFYSPFAFTVSAYIYRFLCPCNPFLALKIAMWLGVMLGAIYIYRLAKEISKNEVGAILAGISYMLAPYLLININARGAFPEVIGQGLLPVALYYSYKLYVAKDYTIQDLLVTGLAWSLLAMSHLITFVNGSILIALFLVFLKKEHAIKRLFSVGLAYLYGFLLALWFLAPVILYEKWLAMGAAILSSPAEDNFLTSLPRLFAIAASGLISSASYGVARAQEIVQPPFYPAIGWSMLLSVGICIYKTYLGINKFVGIDQSVIKALIWIFLLSLFLVWSPFDFWKYLPKILIITRSSYRLLAQLMWPGALLVAIAATLFVNHRYSLQSLFLGIVIIAFSSSSWFIADYNYQVGSSGALRETPMLFYATNDYILKPPSQFVLNNSIKSPISYKEVEKYCSRVGQELHCDVPAGMGDSIELPMLYYPDLIKVMVDGHPIQYTLSHNTKEIEWFGAKETYWLVKLNLGSERHKVVAKFTGLIWANWVSGFAWLSLITAFFISLIKNKKMNLVFTKECNLI